MENGLTNARECAGLSLSDLGRLIGRHCSTVSRWEAGTRSPKPAERLRLAEILGTGVESLFPPFELPAISAARLVAEARTIPDLQRAVARLRGELALLDGTGS